MRLLVTKKRNFLVKDTSKDFHSMYGIITKEQMEKSGELINTNTGKEVLILEPNFLDLYSKIKRQAQIIPLKDIGSIITQTCIDKNSIVIEAGSGSGATGLFIARLVKQVYSYDIREDHLKVVRHNQKYLDIDNIEINLGNIYEGIPIKNADLLILDVPEPWEAYNTAQSCLKSGGYIVSYSPTIPQVGDFVNNLPKNFKHIKSIEIIQREWEINGRKQRPKTYQNIGHSGFLTFVRKIQN